MNFEDVVWDLDDNISSNAFDFKSTMIHELLHAMGFGGGLINEAGDACGSQPPSPGGYQPYDEFVGDSQGPVIDGNSFVMDSSRFLAAVAGGAGQSGLVWHGSQGVAANNGVPIPLYSPSPYQPGSSIAHLDDDFYSSEALLMEAATVEGPGVRQLSAIEAGIMADIGIGQAGGATMGVLSVPGQANGQLGAGETDSFSVAVGGPGRLGISSSGSLDLAGALLLDGQVVAADDDSGSNGNFLIELDVGAAAEYVLQVSGFDASVSGAYQLSATFDGDSQGNGCPQIVDDNDFFWDSTVLTCDGETISAAQAQLYRAYAGALGRQPDQAGYDWWLNEINEGRQTLESMLAGFIFSEEFLGFVNATDGNSIDNAVFLTHIFENVFGRQPDEAGFAFWLGELDSGRRTQAKVLEEMTQSNEFVEVSVDGLVEFLGN